MDLQNDNVGLSGKLRSGFKNCSRMSSEDIENLTCLFGQHLTSIIQTLNRTYGNNTGIPWQCSLLLLLEVTWQAISLVTPQVAEAL